MRYVMRYAFFAGGGWCLTASIDIWVENLLAGKFSPKAPKWWIASQMKESGRTPSAIYAIWAKYPVDRKAMIWQMAPEEDFIAAGYWR